MAGDPHKPFGVDLDPAKELTHEPLSDGDVKATFRGKQMDYDDYIDEMESRATRQSEGKSPIKSSMGIFSGFGKGKLKKSYEK